jgi:hypothetical protein
MLCINNIYEIYRIENYTIIMTTEKIYILNLENEG